MDETLLRALLAITGRLAFPPEEVLKIVASTSGGETQIEAFNLCDGDTPQAEISKTVGLDKGSLSRSVSRWIDEGIMFRVGQDNFPLHIYPLSKLAIRRIAKSRESTNE